MSRILIVGCDTEVSQQISHSLSAGDYPVVCVAGHEDALHSLRARSFGIVITSPRMTVEEDLALMEEMRQIRPRLKFIVLADHSTPEEVIAALRAKVFACFTRPFEMREILNIVGDAELDNQWENEIVVLSAKPGWVSVRANCRQITADRLMTFERELSAMLPEGTRLELMQALREILTNAMEHGAGYDPHKVVVVTAVQTARTLVFDVRDPGSGFRMEELTHAAVTNPPDNPAAHILQRQKKGLRPGGFGLLMAKGTVDELIYNEAGNEVLMIKYLDELASPAHAKDA